MVGALQTRRLGLLMLIASFILLVFAATGGGIWWWLRSTTKSHTPEVSRADFVADLKANNRGVGHMEQFDYVSAA